MAKHRPVLVLTVVSLLVWASPVIPSDPRGYADVSVEWVDDPVGPDERVLRIVIDPAVTARSVKLAFRSPGDISIAPRAARDGRAPPSVEPGPDGVPRVALGDLRRGQAKAVEFVVHVPPSKAGIAVFTVIGEFGPDRSFEERFSWTVGSPPSPTVRHGAAEFPASIIPDEGR